MTKFEKLSLVDETAKEHEELIQQAAIDITKLFEQYHGGNKPMREVADELGSVLITLFIAGKNDKN